MHPLAPLQSCRVAAANHLVATRELGLIVGVVVNHVIIDEHSHLVATREWGPVLGIAVSPVITGYR